MKKFDKKIQIKVVKIILIIIWMIIVFWFSNQGGTKSSGASSRVTNVVVKVVEKVRNMEFTEQEKNQAELVVRKLAHYTIYMIGGFLIMNYADFTDTTRKQQIIGSLAFGAFYAGTDEFHQYFVPGRSARLFDVGIDSLGVMTGILIYIALMFCHIKNKTYENGVENEKGK